MHIWWADAPNDPWMGSIRVRGFKERSFPALALAFEDEKGERTRGLPPVGDYERCLKLFGMGTVVLNAPEQRGTVHPAFEKRIGKFLQLSPLVFLHVT